MNGLRKICGGERFKFRAIALEVGDAAEVLIVEPSVLFDDLGECSAEAVLIAILSHAAEVCERGAFRDEWLDCDLRTLAERGWTPAGLWDLRRAVRVEAVVQFFGASRWLDCDVLAACQIVDGKRVAVMDGIDVRPERGCYHSNGEAFL